MKLYWTTKGRVVYPRPKHPFRITDFIRIGKKLGAQIFKVVSTKDRNTINEVLQLLDDDTSAQLVFYGEQSFGGGTFGGSGSTRSFGETATRILVIIEVIE